MTSARDRHEELLVQLHACSNAEEADRIRDQMAELWQDLDDDERELFDLLSEDLFIIEGERIVTPRVEGETAELVWHQISQAFREQRPADVLVGLRKIADLGAQDAYAFGRSWDKLGFRRGAVCFYDFAYSLEPKPAFLVLALEALMASGQVDEALQRISQIEK